jgi:hypothetical protein
MAAARSPTTAHMVIQRLPKSVPPSKFAATLQPIIHIDEDVMLSNVTANLEKSFKEGGFSDMSYG